MAYRILTAAALCVALAAVWLLPGLGTPTEIFAAKITFSNGLYITAPVGFLTKDKCEVFRSNLHDGLEKMNSECMKIELR